MEPQSSRKRVRCDFLPCLSSLDLGLQHGIRSSLELLSGRLDRSGLISWGCDSLSQGFSSMCAWIKYFIYLLFRFSHSYKWRGRVWGEEERTSVTLFRNLTDMWKYRESERLQLRCFFREKKLSLYYRISWSLHPWFCYFPLYYCEVALKQSVSFKALYQGNLTLHNYSLWSFCSHNCQAQVHVCIWIFMVLSEVDTVCAPSFKM